MTSSLEFCKQNKNLIHISKLKTENLYNNMQFFFFYKKVHTRLLIQVDKLE